MADDSDDDTLPWIPPAIGTVPNFPLPNDVPVRMGTSARGGWDSARGRSGAGARARAMGGRLPLLPLPRLAPRSPPNGGALRGGAAAQPPAAAATSPPHMHPREPALSVPPRPLSPLPCRSTALTRQSRWMPPRGTG